MPSPSHDLQDLHMAASICGVLVLLSPIGSSAQEVASNAHVERRVAAMGTELTLEVFAPDRAAALAASEQALRSIEATEARLSTWREDSELSRLNSTPVGVHFEPSPLLARDLTRALHWRDATGGAFSPTASSLVEAWGLREGGKRPSDAELEAAITASGPDAIEFALPNSALRRIEAAGVEEGGFGKGVALDEAAQALIVAGVTRAFIDFGGQTLLLGEDPEAAVALAHPDDRELGVLHLALAPGSSATSGNSEHGIRVDGERLGHVLDPRSGQPARDFGTLTVCTRSATDADCLSTALYVMGPEAALRFAHERPALDVIVLERGDSGLRARATLGLRERLTPLATDLTIDWYEPASEASAAASTDSPARTPE